MRRTALLTLLLGLPALGVAAPEGLDNDALERLIRERTGSQTQTAPRATATPQRSTASADEAGDLIMNAMSLIGVSYRFGGNSPTQGLDCSAFMQYIFRHVLPE